MRTKALDKKKASQFGRRQPGKAVRRATVGGAVTYDEKDAILSALEKAGMTNQSEGVRKVMLLFATDPDVQAVILGKAA